MYSRLLEINVNTSALILGPRGTGKTQWLKTRYPDALYFDLLNTEVYAEFLARPYRLEALIPEHYKNWIIIDEVQRVPELLNEVHRLIEHLGYKFLLTGSSARSLRRKGVNLLAGRAYTYHMHPLTTHELNQRVELQHSLKLGRLPQTFAADDPERYLGSYVQTYLREEVLQEGLTRNLAMFARFLEIASFSQGETVNYSEIARETGSSNKTVMNYFDILEDLLLGIRLPVFTKKAKRDLVAHPKFYYFDVGVYRTIRPQGPLDSVAESDGPALETLFLQEIRALNDYHDLGFSLHYWRTRNQVEVDFILYGKLGLFAFEIKRKQKLSGKDFQGLKLFQEDYPQAKCYMLYGGRLERYEANIEIMPFEKAMQNLVKLING